MIRKKSRTFSLFAERIGIKILFEIGLLLIIVCGTLSIIPLMHYKHQYRLP